MDIAELNRIASDYVAAFAREGTGHFIANLETEISLYPWGERLLPLTVNHGRAGRTFVCSPRVGYIDYPIEELRHFPNKAMVPALRALIGGVGGVLARCDIERIVHVNNWMMSTNLPVLLDRALVKGRTEALVDQYPAHFLAMRSLTERHSALLMAALRATGWVLMPTRQIFVVDDVARDCLPHRDTRRDDKLWRAGAFTYEELTDMRAPDAQRIVELYGMLYLEKYSRLNPAYTADFVALTHEIGLLRYLVLRDQGGTIQAFGAMLRSGSHATMPMIGYDIGLARELGLYRLAFHAGTRFAAREGLAFNMSSGATTFKRNRGAIAEMEYTAFYLQHLPFSRRCPFEILRFVAQQAGEPILRKYQL